MTQNNLYSKNLQQTPTILWFYCIDLFKSILKHQDLLFYKFSMNWYWISKFTTNHNKQVPIALFKCVTDYSKNTLGFLFFQPEVPGPGQRGEAVVDRPFPGEGLTGGEGGGVWELHGFKAHHWVRLGLLSISPNPTLAAGGLPSPGNGRSTAASPLWPGPGTSGWKERKPRGLFE